MEHIRDKVRRGEPLTEQELELLHETSREAPDDLEAQLILGRALLTTKPTLEAFTGALLAKLRAQSTPHLVAQGFLSIRMGRGEVVQFELKELFEEACAADVSANATVELLAREFAEHSLGLVPGQASLLTKVLPVVRDSSFLPRGQGLARREGPAGLWFFYALENPEALLYVPDEVLSSHHSTLEELDAAAWKNLEAASAEVRALELEQGALRLSAVPTGLWALAHGDGHDAARLLTPSHQAAIARVCGQSPMRVYLGLRELVLLCREDDVVSVKKLESLDAAREGIVGAWRLWNGQLTPRRVTP